MRLLVPAAAAAVLIATAAAADAAPPRDALAHDRLHADALPGGGLRGGALPRVAQPAASLAATTLPRAASLVAGTTRTPGADVRRPAPDPAGVTVSGAAAPTTRERPRGGFAMPLSPRPTIHRRFEQPRDQWSRGHRGVDLLASVGQPVLSPGEGVVAFSGVIAGRGVITVRHSGELRTTYEPVDARLASGRRVHRGDALGVISPAAGHCVPLTCLHWGAISGMTYRDPLTLLGIGRPVLLPLG
jgi:murein DD-endopeptidase MepM/ murein hydrolase activator NlpD